MTRLRKVILCLVLVFSVVGPVAVTSAPPAQAYHYNSFKCDHTTTYYHTDEWHQVVWVKSYNSGGYHYHFYNDYVYRNGWYFYTDYWRRCGLS